MPPVASTKESAWGQAMLAVLEDNKAAGKRPDSWRSLYAALAAQSDQKADTWKRNISRYRPATAAQPTEPVAQMIADALGVPRSSLPKAEPVTLALLAYRLEELAEKVDQLQTRTEAHARMQVLLAAIGRAPRQGSQESPSQSLADEQSAGQ